jgi:hypothetical protein
MRTKVGSSATTPFHDPLGHALKTIESCHWVGFLLVMV